MIINLDISYCRRLVAESDDAILKELQKYTSFEVAVGANGTVWIKASNIQNSILIMNIIRGAEKMDN